MTQQEDLPEEATVEPIIRTPQEDTDRAWRRWEKTSAEAEAGQEPDDAQARSPLRTPGEPSSPPKNIPPERR